MLRAARELLAVRSPLDAELMVSELLGIWWRQEPARHARRRRRHSRADMEELFGEGLVGYAADQGSPAALALLSGIACLGTARQAIKAEQAALGLMEHGVARPAWAEHAGAVEAGECYVNSDAYGDRDEVICVYRYAGQDEHALVVAVDYNAGGMIRDGWVTSQVGKLLEYCRDLNGRDQASRDPLGWDLSGWDGAARPAFSQVPPPDARRLLESALSVTESSDDPPVSKSFPAYHAFIRTRIRTLPPVLASTAQPGAALAGASRAVAAHGAAAHGATAHGAAAHGAAAHGDATHGDADAARGADHASRSHGGAVQPRPAQRHAHAAPTVSIGPGACRRPTWRADRRAMLVAEFLASDEAEDLSDLEAASRCADHIVNYGCDRDFGRPLRISPAKAETFLLDWLPRKIMLTPSEQYAMPHVLVAWARWAGARSGLDIAAISKTLDSVFDSIAAFTKVYRDPASFGLEPGLVARLLPDRDLEALPRRAFAFGLLEGTFRGTDLSSLDPSLATDRRVLIAADHDDPAGQPASAEHLDRHAALTERLWHGDPPELWEAAQRMLDLGMPRHDVVHALIDAVGAAGRDERAISLALRALPPEPAS